MIVVLGQTEWEAREKVQEEQQQQQEEEEAGMVELCLQRVQEADLLWGEGEDSLSVASQEVVSSASKA